MSNEKEIGASSSIASYRSRTSGSYIPGKKNASKITESEEEKIRFKIEEEHSEADYKSRNLEVADETVRLYLSMPKGLEYFITTGPPKRVHDYTDYEKLSEDHERLKIERDLQREPRRQRLATLADKNLHFMNAVKTFNHFLVDMERKEKRARLQFQKHQEERKRLMGEAPGLLQKLAGLKKIRNNRLEKFEKIQKVIDFVDKMKKHGDCNFKNFHDVMDRYKALAHTYMSQVSKYMDNMEELESTKEYYENLLIESKENILRLRTELMEKQLELDRESSLVSHLTQVVRYHQEQDIRKQADIWRMTSGINNMVTSLMDFRPFTIGRLRHKTDTFSQIEAIGEIIADYNIILVPVTAEESVHEEEPKAVLAADPSQEHQQTRRVSVKSLESEAMSNTDMEA